MPGAWEIKTNAELIVATPCPKPGLVSFAWALALRQLEVPDPCYWFSTNIPRVDLARIQCVEAMFRHNCEYILFLDSDVIPIIPLDNKGWIVDKYAVMKLLDTAKRYDIKVLSGLYFEKENDAEHHPCAWVWVEGRGLQHIAERSGLVQVDAIGLGFCLIHRSVFEQMSKPWFKYMDEPHEWAKYSENPEMGIGEDFYFCYKLQKELGIRPVVDCSIKCIHIGFGSAREEGVTLGDI
jgi:hypothetical protein